jgi:hypothetical protein
VPHGSRAASVVKQGSVLLKGDLAVQPSLEPWCFCSHIVSLQARQGLAPDSMKAATLALSRDWSSS